MNNSISIRLSKNIRDNYAQIPALTTEKPPELEARLAVYDHLAQSMDDIKLGRVQDADYTFDDIIGELNNLKL